MEIFLLTIKKEQFKVWLDTFNLQYKMDIPFIDKLVKPSLYSPSYYYSRSSRKGGGVMVEFPVKKIKLFFFITGRPAPKGGFPTPKDVLLGPWS